MGIELLIERALEHYRTANFRHVDLASGEKLLMATGNDSLAMSFCPDSEQPLALHKYTCGFSPECWPLATEIMEDLRDTICIPRGLSDYVGTERCPGNGH